jgi:hypothetical protein
VLRFDVTSIAAVAALLGVIFLMAMFRGLTEIFLAFEVRRLSKELTTV